MQTRSHTKKGTKLPTPNLSLSSTNTTALAEREAAIEFQDSPTKKIQRKTSPILQMAAEIFAQQSDEEDVEPGETPKEKEGNKGLESDLNEEIIDGDVAIQPMNESDIEEDFMEEETSQHSGDSKDSEEDSREQFKNYLKDSVQEVVNQQNSILLDEVQKIGSSFKDIQRAYNMMNKEFKELKTQRILTPNMQTPWIPITQKVQSSWTTTKVSTKNMLTPLQREKVKE
jgi:hypothetical protein